LEKAGIVFTGSAIVVLILLSASPLS
jgi:hypothetical protein